MKRLYSTLTALTIALLGFGQSDDPSTPTVISLPFYSMGGWAAGSITGATGSAPASCNAPADDVFYGFTASTQGVKIEATTADFDMVLEILDASDVLLDCMDNVFGVGGETWFYTNLTPGDDYKIRIYSNAGTSNGNFSIKAEWLPDVYVRDGWWPTDAVDDLIDGIYGYKINQQPSRRLTSTAGGFPITFNASVDATMWEFTDQGNATVYTHTILGGANTKINLNDVVNPSTLCFGTTYDVRVQLVMEGQECGYSEIRELDMEAMPTTRVTLGYPNQFYDMATPFRADFVGDSQQIYWQLTTDNGQTVINHDYTGSPSSWIYGQDVLCMRYNKIYAVEVTVEYCGTIGSWSTPITIFTEALPYSNVRAEYCNTYQWAGGTILCDFIPQADQYAFQLAPIVEDDPDMVPIGPAIVAYRPTTALYLLDLLAEGLTYGQAYRVAAKPFLGIADGCDDQQEGDYGWFCQIVIIDPADPPSPPPFGSEDNNIYVDLSEAGDGVKPFRLFPNPTESRTITVSAMDFASEGLVHFSIMDLNGQKVHEQSWVKSKSQNLFELGLSPDLGAGLYLVVADHNGKRHTERLIIN